MSTTIAHQCTSPRAIRPCGSMTFVGATPLRGIFVTPVEVTWPQAIPAAYLA